jgi:hypothetical protein
MEHRVEFDPVNATVVGLGASPPQHPRREVGRGVVQHLFGSEAAECHAAAARDVERTLMPVSNSESRAMLR